MVGRHLGFYSDSGRVLVCVLEAILFMGLQCIVYLCATYAARTPMCLVASGWCCVTIWFIYTAYQFVCLVLMTRFCDMLSPYPQDVTGIAKILFHSFTKPPYCSIASTNTLSFSHASHTHLCVSFSYTSGLVCASMNQHDIKSESVGLDYTAVLYTEKSQSQSPEFQVNTGA